MSFPVAGILNDLWRSSVEGSGRCAGDRLPAACCLPPVAWGAPPVTSWCACRGFRHRSRARLRCSRGLLRYVRRRSRTAPSYRRSLPPGLEHFREGAFAGRVLFEREDGAAVVVVDHRDVATAAIPSVRNFMLAEGGGFEPPVDLRLRQFSRLLQSTTLPSLRNISLLVCFARVAPLWPHRRFGERIMLSLNGVRS